MPSDSKADQYNELMSNLARTKEAWDQEDGVEDEQDRLLSEAIGMAIEQGNGWGPGEKEAYLDKILDDDFIPPIFASSVEEVEKSGLQDAFTSLIYDGESPTSLMLSFRTKANDSFASGKRNVVGNHQYYRDAINFYIEALGWALKIEPMEEGDFAQADTNEPTYNETELDQQRGTICANVALMHMQLKNWGFVRDESKRALVYDKTNVKAWYRLAKAYQMLQNWEEAGDAIDTGLAVPGESENKDLRKIQKLLADRVRRARQQRQQRERARAERVSKVKDAWKYCKDRGIKLGRVSLVSSVTDDDEDDENRDESRWHQHLPNSGVLPTKTHGEWNWPCMFLYPSHQQSDFIQKFAESDMMASRIAEMFPEIEAEDGGTLIPWDYNHEFTCSKLAVYVEIHNADEGDGVVHPESVEPLRDQASCMRFYEAARALKGDEGPDMANVIRAVERKHLYQQRKAWKKKHGSLWAKPDPNTLLRVHPALTLREVLVDPRIVVPNFLVTFIVFPENHPAHAAYLKEHKCVGVLQPKEVQG
jgi:tetratricopeptide (TPR) repeat protein